MSRIDGGALTARALRKFGLKQVFGLVGYQISPIYVGCRNENINIYGVRHEQAAVHMADGYAQVTGKPAVVTVIGGPGFANTTMGILKAYYSHTPMIVIVGAFDPSKRDTGGLQDLNQLSCVRDHVKWCGTVYDTKRIPEYIAIAYRNAVNGRRGPVVLEIPINVLGQSIDENEVIWPEHYHTDACIRGDERYIERAVELIQQAERPMLVSGNGIFYSNGSEILREFVEYTSIPTFTMNAGRGTLPDSHPLCFGNGRPLDAGDQLNAYKNTDLVIIAGSSIDYTFFFMKGAIYNPELKVIQIDIDPCEIGKNSRPIDVGIIGNSASVLKDMLEIMKRKEISFSGKYQTWINQLQNNKREFDKRIKDVPGDSPLIHPVHIMDAINRIQPEDSIVVLDGSNAMFWGSQFIQTQCPGHQIIGPSGTYGPMGTGLGLALGAKIAKPGKKVLLYTGDGSFGFDIADIATAVEYKIPVVVIIHNDAAWGFCRETQQLIYNETCGTELGMIHYEEIAKSFGAQGTLVTRQEDFIPALKEALDANTFFVINVKIDPTAISPGANFLNHAHKIYKEFA